MGAEWESNATCMSQAVSLYNCSGKNLIHLFMKKNPEAQTKRNNALLVHY